MHVRVRSITAAATLAAIMIGGPASASPSYEFDVQYDGGNSAHLLPGSDSFPASMVPDDSFVYTLTAEPGKLWLVTATADYFAMFALATQEEADRVGDVSLTLSLGDVTQDTFQADGITTSFVHVGTNSVPLSAGLMFDSFTLAYTLLSAEPGAPETAAVEAADTTLNGPLPLFGAPEFHFSGGVTYIPAVPEPQTWALMLGGLLVVGRLAHRTRSQA